VPALSEGTRNRLAAFLPKEAALSNPVDMIASAPASHFGMALSALLDDAAIDAVIVINIPIVPAEEVAEAIKKAMAAYEGDKTVLACFMMSEARTLNLDIPGERNVPVYLFPEDAVQALFHAYNYSSHREAKEGKVPVLEGIDEEKVRKGLQSSGAIRAGGGWLAPDEAIGLLREYGIPVVETKEAYNPDEAAAVAEALGFPVAMKIRSRTITHKTDVGGLMLGLRNGDEVRTAFLRLTERLEAAGYGSEMEGVIVQPMVTGAQEVIAGMSQDPVFGPLIMVGLGGIHVELFKDVAFSIHPLTDLDPDFMLSQLKALPLLEGWRGSPRRDLGSLRDVLLRFSALIEDFPEILEVEINPLMVLEEGKGCIAVDARVLFGQSES
jgi:acyl-CoA synthetase (NDP forming)